MLCCSGQPFRSEILALASQVLDLGRHARTESLCLGTGFVEYCLPSLRSKYRIKMCSS